MQFKLSLIYNYKTEVSTIVDINNITISDISCIREADIWEYNDIFSKIIAEKKDSIEYLISPTLTRMEPISLFYDRICKFIYCLERIYDRKENIIFMNLDFKIIKALIQYAKKHKIKIRYNFLNLFLYNLATWLKFIRDAIKIISLKLFSIILSRAIIKIPKNLSYNYAFYSFYDYRSYNEGKHRDEYFDPLLRYLVQQQKRIIIFNRPFHHNKVSLFLKYLFEIASFQNDYQDTINERYINLKDLVLSVVYGFLKRPKINREIIFRNYDISYLAQLSIREDFFQMNWLTAYLDYFFAKNILTDFSIDNIFYPYENQPWEKAFILARNEISSPTKLIGIQLSSFSFKFLQYFPGKYEQKICLLPNRVLTVGKILKNLLETNGYNPPGLIEQGCALRYAYLFEKELRLAPKRNKNRKIAYAFSFDARNYKIILANLVRIFSDSTYTIYLKFHPNHFHSLNIKQTLPKNFINAGNISWQKLFSEIDILLYDDNSLGIEALRYNITVGYFTLTGQIYNTDRLFEYKKNKIIIDSIENFKDFLEIYYQDGLVYRFNDNEIERYNQEYLGEYFSPITDEYLARYL